MNGTRNFLVSQTSYTYKKNPDEAKDKRKFYLNLIQLSRNVNMKNRVKAVKRLNSDTYTLKENTINKVLNVYHMTIQNTTDKHTVGIMIKRDLIKNLKKVGVHHQVVKNIAQYEKIDIKSEYKHISNKTSMENKSIENKEIQKPKTVNKLDNQLKDVFNVIHPYLKKNPYRVVSTDMEDFWEERIGNSQRLKELQLIYQQKKENPQINFFEVLQAKKVFTKRERKQLKAVWREDQYL